MKESYSKNNHSRVAKDLLELIKDHSDNYNLGLITPLEYVQLAYKLCKEYRNSLVAIENEWCIKNKENGAIYKRYLYSATEAAEILDGFSENRDRYKIEMI